MDHGLSREDAIKIGTAMFTDPLWSGMDLSSTGEEQAIIESYHRKYPEYGDTIEWFINHCEYMHVPREDVWERVHQLKGLGYTLVSAVQLSGNNVSQAHRQCSVYRRYVRWHHFLSGKTDQAKCRDLPVSSSEYDLVAHECLFFDDRADNTEGARKQGIHAITVTSRQFLVDELDKINSSKELLILCCSTLTYRFHQKYSDTSLPRS